MKKIFLWLFTIGWVALIWRLTTVPDFHPSPDTLLSFFISNGGHFFFFGILAVLLKLSFNAKKTFLPITITALYGITIEIVQRSIPGRSFSLIDWSLDILGAIVFLAILRKSPKIRVLINLLKIKN